MSDTNAVDEDDVNIKQVSEEFLQFEQDLDLMTRTIDGVRFWERVRFRIHRRLVEEAEDDIDNDGTNVREYLSGFWLFLRNLAIRNPYFGGKTDLLFYGTGRRKRLEGEYTDIYVDPLLEDLPWRYQCLERPYNLSHLRPVQTDNLRYTDAIEYAGVLGEKLGIGTVSLTADEKTTLDWIATKLESRFDQKISLVEMVRSDLSKRKIRLRLYRSLLRRADPDLALLVNSYNGRETFVEACSEEEVPVAELQHGVINRHHMGYSFPDEKKSVFPDYFLSFGNFWSDAVNLPLPDSNIFFIGYPHLERTYDRYRDEKIEDQIVFISQANIGEELSRLATKIADHSDFTDAIVYKLHPKEFGVWRERYPWLVDANVEVVTDEPPLYQVFSESKAQVGVYSTAVYEGLRFNLNTYIFELPGFEHMRYLLENEYATSFDTAEDFLDLYGKGPNTEMEIDIEYFFESDAISNFNRSVNIILERQ